MTTGRGPGRVAALGAALLAAVAAVGIMAAVAGAEVIYRNIPSRKAGLPALGFESDSVWEFGGEVKFAGSDRSSPTVTVDLASYACQTGAVETCATRPGASFEWPITLTIYEVGPGDAVGPLLIQLTKAFQIPYRPSETPSCPNEGWTKGFGKECAFAKMHEVSWSLPRFTLPEEAIVAVAYNTETYGAKPTGQEGPYNSLNVAINADYKCTKENPTTKQCESGEYENANTSPPSVGSDPLPEQAFINTTYSALMCGEPTGSFRATGLDCWKFEQPAFEVKAKKK